MFSCCLLLIGIIGICISNAFRVHSALAGRYMWTSKHVGSNRNAKTKGEPEKPFPFARDGPGHVDNLPKTLTNQNKQELIRVILGIAVLYLNFRVKVQKAFARVNSDLGNSETSSRGNGREDVLDAPDEIVNSVSAESNVIRYVDLKEGTVLPRDKEMIFVTAKFFYNGVEVCDATRQEYGSLIQHHKDPTTYLNSCRALSLPKALENAGALKGLMNMKINGKRHVSLQLGEEGLPPYVPPHGTMIAEYEIKLTNTA